MQSNEMELAQQFSKGNDTAALELMRLWKLPLTKAGFTEAAKRMIKLVPGFPDAVVWNEPHENETALTLFANTNLN